MWKRAGNVQFGANVRCREVTTVDGVKFTVYSESADCDSVDEYLGDWAYVERARNLRINEDLPVGYAERLVGDDIPDPDLPTKIYPPSTLQATIEEAAKEHEESLLPTQKYGKDK